MRDDQDIIKCHDCKACKGRGYFIINPFRDRGLMNPDNIEQCRDCLTAYTTHLEAGGKPATPMKR